MNSRERNIIYGLTTDLIFDLNDLKFKHRERKFLPDNEIAVYMKDGIHEYKFTFSRLRDDKLELLDVSVAEYDMPHANLVLDYYASKNDFSVGCDLYALVISEEKYNTIKERL